MYKTYNTNRYLISLVKFFLDGVFCYSSRTVLASPRHYILLTHCYYHRGTRLNVVIPPKRFDSIFSPNWGMLRRSMRVLVFL